MGKADSMHDKNSIFRSTCLLLGLGLLWTCAALSGCRGGHGGGSASSSTQPATEKAERARENVSPEPGHPSAAADVGSLQPVSLPAGAESGAVRKETWDAQSIQGKRVGYAHTVVRDIEQNGQPLEYTEQDSVMTLVREGQPIKQTVRLAVWETPEGQLRGFETQMASAGSETTARGVVRDGQLTIDTDTLGKTSRQTIPWKDEWGGFFAAERSLADKALAPGEERSVWGLLPIFHIPAETTLKAVDYETVSLPGGEQRLLRIESSVQIGNQRIESVVWTDAAGDVLKSVIPGVQQEAVRTSRADAVSTPEDAPLDLIAASVVPLQGKLPDPPRTKRAVYRATLRDGKIEGLFDDCLSQHVTPIDERTARLEVVAVRPDEPTDIEKQEQPSKDDLAPNNLVQSDDARVVHLAASVAADEADPWKLACALERKVHEAVRRKNFSQAFATAAEVAERREGDCTEHAVLLAALCRARDLPARVAFGLVYYPPQDGFAYHMWNEVWMGDRWVPLDATLGRGGIGADHIKLADSNLQGSTAYSAMLPVIQVFGRLELEVVEAE